MDCFNCLKNGSPPYYTFLTNGSILCLHRVSDAGSSIVNFFNDVSQCGPIDSSTTLGAIIGGAFAGALGLGAAIMIGYWIFKKYYGVHQLLPQQINNNANNNIFGFANPNFGLGLARDAAPPANPLLQNQNPDFERMEDFQHLVIQPAALPALDDELDNININNDHHVAPNAPPELVIAQAENRIPAAEFFQDHRVFGISTYGRLVRRVRTYPEAEFGV